MTTEYEEQMDEFEDDTGEGWQQNGDADDSLYCKLCDVHVSTEEEMKKHKKDKPHNRVLQFHKKVKLRAEAKKKGLIVYTSVPVKKMQGPCVELVDWIQVVNKPLVGLEHIIEVHRFNGSQLKYYICEVCGVSNMAVIHHLLGIGHIKQYVIEHYHEMKGAIDSLKTSEEERQALNVIVDTKNNPFVEKKHYLTYEKLRVLCIDLAQAIIQKHGRKRVRAVRETKSTEIQVNRQPCLAKQVPGHTEHHYPPKLMEMFNTHGANFSKFGGSNNDRKKMERAGMLPGHQQEDRRFGPPMDRGMGSMAGRGGGSMPGRGGSILPLPGLMGAGDGPPPWEQERQQSMGSGMGQRRPPMSMGEASRQPASLGNISSSSKKFTLLDWLHKTVEKLDNSILHPQDFGLGERAASLLEAGIGLYQAGQDHDEMCTYPRHVDWEGATLAEWLDLTITFFEKAWICSAKEVRIAKVIISQIQAAVNKPETQSRLDPYERAASRSMPGAGLLGGPPMEANPDPFEFDGPVARQGRGILGNPSMEADPYDDSFKRSATANMPSRNVRSLLGSPVMEKRSFASTPPGDRYDEPYGREMSRTGPMSMQGSRSILGNPTNQAQRMDPYDSAFGRDMPRAGPMKGRASMQSMQRSQPYRF